MSKERDTFGALHVLDGLLDGHLVVHHEVHDFLPRGLVGVIIALAQPRGGVCVV